MKEKVVGVIFDGSNKVYHYITDKEYIVGQRLKVFASNDGTEMATIVEIDSNVRVKNMKYLREA